MLSLFNRMFEVLVVVACFVLALFELRRCS
jgi:hypothetical protein